jgi:hypothetical protein
MILQPVLIDEQERSIPLRMKVIESLAKFRQEWQALAEGQSLLDVQVPVGLMLVDIANRLELNEQEKSVVLGRKLMSQADAFLEQSVQVKTR